MYSLSRGSISKRGRLRHDVQARNHTRYLVKEMSRRYYYYTFYSTLVTMSYTNWNVKLVDCTDGMAVRSTVSQINYILGK